MPYWATLGLFQRPTWPQWATEKAPGWSNMTQYHVAYQWEVFWGVLGSCRAIWGHEWPFLVMTGHFLCYFGPLWGPCWPPKRAQGGPTWHIIMLYSHLKWFRVIWGHAVPFWAILVILSHSGHFGALLGHFGAPVGTWMAPGWSNMTYNHAIYPWGVF